jgi:hypothetical protein
VNTARVSSRAALGSFCQNRKLNPAAFHWLMTHSKFCVLSLMRTSSVKGFPGRCCSARPSCPLQSRCWFGSHSSLSCRLAGASWRAPSPLWRSWREVALCFTSAQPRRAWPQALRCGAHRRQFTRDGSGGSDVHSAGRGRHGTANSIRGCRACRCYSKQLWLMSSDCFLSQLLADHCNCPRLAPYLHGLASTCACRTCIRRISWPHRDRYCGIGSNFC